MLLNGITEIDFCETEVWLHLMSYSQLFLNVCIHLFTCQLVLLQAY